MAVPEFQAFMLPLLAAASDGKEHRMKDLVTLIARDLQLSEEDLARRLPSGRQSVAENRVYWAGTYLRKAGLLSSPAKGRVTITDEGRRVLAERPARIDSAFLGRYPSFKEFRGGAAASPEPMAAVPLSGQVDMSPQERIESGWREFNTVLAQDLLEKVKESSWKLFERLVVDVLVAMGYGGGRPDASRIVGKAGDGGVDGTIFEDELGLDVIYVQAKKWEGSVGADVVQRLAGSLDQFRATKGVVITTSTFTPAAKESADRIGKRIVLIDGARLVNLMIEHNVGVEPLRQTAYQLKKVDIDYFDESGGLD